MDIVSFETAKRLKEAGFPQPAPAPGQWWGMDGQLTYISDGPVGYLTAVHYSPGKAPVIQAHCNAHDFSWSVFLPTATDILRLLPGHDFYFDGEHFAFPGDMQQGGENPAEVAAEKWLP